ncbi:22773_t:CDS:1, partial [Racocetra persica]
EDVILDVNMIQELPQDRIAEEDILQVKPMKEVTITQEKTVE